MRTIQLSKGHKTVVDDEDFDLVSPHKWCAMPTHHGGIYAMHKNHRGLSVLMHRLIIGASTGEMVDHIDGDKLNNRRANLRRCTVAQNNQNCGIRKNNVSGFKGVGFLLGKGKYQARIRHNGKRHYLGSFTNAKEAALAYDAAARKFHGEFARVNFPAQLQGAAKGEIG